MKRSVTIIDIAKHAGVSFKTVSRVVNGAPTVAADLRARVEAAMRELDYTPNRAARLLRGGKAYALGLIVGSPVWLRHSPDPDRRLPTYTADVILGLLQACHGAEHHLVIENISPGDEEAGRRALERFLGLVKLDGIALIPSLCDIPWVLDVLEHRNLPFVRINPGLELDRGLCFVIDNKSAAREVGEALLSHGHRSIGFITGPETHAAQRERKTGLLEAIACVPDASVEIRQGNFLFTSGLEQGRELLNLPDRPTAIFAANDEMAAGVLAAAVDCGLRVPDDLSLIGFGGLAISEYSLPRLATVSQPTIEIARMAGERLIGYDASVKAEWAEVITIPYELALRQSVAAAPTAAPIN